MIKKKICMLGSFAVGKTSLVQQFVSGIFSEKYLTTIGVKIDQKVLEIDEQSVTLLVWDIHGEDEFQKVPLSYLRGSAGLFLIMDGTRIKTLDVVKRIKEKADEEIGNVPFKLLVNKADLTDDWVFTKEVEARAAELGGEIFLTSAKTGMGVEEAFVSLTKEMIR